MPQEDFWDGIERNIERAVEQAGIAMQGASPPTTAEVDDAKDFLESTTKYTPTEIGRMSGVQLVREAADEHTRQAIGIDSRVKPAYAVRAAEKAQEAEEAQLIRDYLLSTGKYTPAEVGRMATGELVEEITDEAQRQLIANASRLDPATLKLHIDATLHYQDRVELEDFVVGTVRLPREQVEKMSDQELAIWTETGARLADHRGSGSTSTTPSTPSTPRSLQESPSAPNPRDSLQGGGFEPIDSIPSDPTSGSPTDTGPTDTGPTDTGPTDTGPVDNDPADNDPADSGPTGTGGGVDGGDDGQATNPGPATPGAGGAGGEEGESSGWTYVGEGTLQGASDPSYDGQHAEVYEDRQGNLFAVTDDGTVIPVDSSRVTDSEGQPMDIGSGGGSAPPAGEQETGGSEDEQGSAPPSDGEEESDSDDSENSDDESSDSDDSDSDSGSDSDSDSESDSGGDEGSDSGEEGGGVGYTPIEGEQFVDLRRITLDPAAAVGSGGDVDPADPAFDGGVEVTGELIDLKLRLLVDPVDPEFAGSTGRGSIPETFQPDAGVIDPSDDATSGPGEMGPDDDPFADMQPGLEPAVPDDPVDDAPFEAIDPSFRLLGDLEPVQNEPIMDFDNLDH